MPEIRIIIPGVPIAQHRPRFARRGKYVQTYSDQKSEAGKFLLLAKPQIPKCAPQGTPVTLTCLFVFPIPKSATKKTLRGICDMNYAHVKKPDVSNMLKFVEDCLNGTAWHDDSQVVCTQCSKAYTPSCAPHTEIVISWDELIDHAAVPGAAVRPARLTGEG